ncbi:hypothetical protein M406DRAFT_341802 [Cryphonectria parasitica EP155]|uniref:Rhodopsin domain-containing protein n=1 Tax=Cryphonectria parasitica (strain ATCC 38755 / EP155) TaxID=660469 RepID=A0A9P4XY15_CRYP1|nr:uncharacterized protein M406DRAFT_341802 [Cryphonectria parasitica EP155]KAF3762615.1 hypothetical protein M406DRAFT_341802 [Cryphonectria parasitica EP155]
MGWVFNAPGDTSTWGPQIVAIATTFTGFSLIIVCMRIYVRAHLIHAMGLDDWAIIFGWFGICGYSICTIIQTRWGLGVNHIDDMPIQDMKTFLLIEYIGSPLYVCCLFGFKFSLLLSYLRFIPRGVWRFATIGMAIAVTLAHIAFLCCFLFGCSPIAKFWDANITWGHCLGLPFYTGFSALTITFDFLIMLLPFPTLLRTKIRTRKKVVLCCLFTLGVFISAVQIVRFSYLSQLVNLLDSANPIVWSIVESNLGIVTASIPTLAPLVRYFSEKSRVGIHDDDSTERIYDPSQGGIMKRTDVLVSSSQGRTSEQSVPMDENTL